MCSPSEYYRFLDIKAFKYRLEVIRKKLRLVSFGSCGLAGLPVTPEIEGDLEKAAVDFKSRRY
jgi:hypothetical protein